MDLCLCTPWPHLPAAPMACIHGNAVLPNYGSLLTNPGSLPSPLPTSEKEHGPHRLQPAGGRHCGGGGHFLSCFEGPGKARPPRPSSAGLWSRPCHLLKGSGLLRALTEALGPGGIQLAGQSLRAVGSVAGERGEGLLPSRVGSTSTWEREAGE